MEVTQFDVELADGRTVHAYDTGGLRADDGQLAVFWHHGTPNIGAPPAPLFAAAQRLGVRFVSHDRPGYGGSTSHPGRDVGSAAGDVAAVADRLGIGRFAVLGHSGGGPHALACAALLPDRVTGVACGASLAPFGADGLDWYAGMLDSGTASLRAAAEGRAAKERYELSGAEYDPEFTAADMATLAGPWSWLGSVVGPAMANGPGGLVDDDIAYVTPWGFEPADVVAPTLFLHGGLDRIVPSAHGAWLAAKLPNAELRLVPDAGHISVLDGAEGALAWLRDVAARGA